MNKNREIAKKHTKSHGENITEEKETAFEVQKDEDHQVKWLSVEAFFLALTLYGDAVFLNK